MPASAFPLVRLLGELPLPVIALGPGREVIFWNPAAEETFGWDQSEVLGEANPIVPDEKRDEFQSLDDRVRAGEELTGISVRRVTKQGEELELALWSRPLEDDAGRRLGSVAVFIDRSEQAKHLHELRKAAEAALNQTFEALDRAVHTSLATHMAILDEEGHVVTANDAWRRIGEADAEADIAGHPLGANLLEVCTELAIGGGPFQVIAQRLRGLLQGSEGAFQVEYPLTPGTSGPDRWHLFSAYPFDEGEEGVAVVAIVDITERKELEKELEWMAYRDALTGLANRRLLQEVGQQALKEARRYQRNVGYLHLDLRRFKAINDTLGHPVGDQVLVEVGKRLERCFRGADVVARTGGDEFVVVLSEIGDAEEDLRVAAERAQEALASEPIAVDEATVEVQPQIGAAVSVDGGVEFFELQRQADIALREAKLEGSAPVRVYEPELARYSADQLELERELRAAIDGGDLTLHFQPVVRAGSEGIVGMEALVRWPHSERGLIGAGVVVSLAEEIRVVRDLDLWVLAEAATHLQRWSEAGWDGWVSVNLDARSLADPDLIAAIEPIVEGLSEELRGRLVLEITEHSAMRSPGTTAEQLHRLRELGLMLAIDDFGTGYSSLAYLKRFPVDLLKVDQIFVREIGHKRTDERLMQAVVGIGASLDIRIVAEGVETDEQKRWLESIGCDLLQGYLLGRPAPAEEWSLE